MTTGARSLDYVRSYYGVPARCGMRVEVDGRPGRITGGDGQYIRVRFDGDKHAQNCHPLWRVHYLIEGGDA